jgi:hypothetical protein
MTIVVVAVGSGIQLCVVSVRFQLGAKHGEDEDSYNGTAHIYLALESRLIEYLSSTLAHFSTSVTCGDHVRHQSVSICFLGSRLP